ncbi:protein TolQ [Sphingosinicella soli]|uniref:Biopolymer transport protein TolQ n=1 Tax=Sphingosinicella soli TaxID=333708 RepID=A0A7W7B3Z4_9SPHN|nr:protein TolQ [Sphingosinicella soli]MBB4633550.1 biopolymer transport protein TolQ [Sphingosinicella soli]
METEVANIALAGAADMSPWALFMQADIVVKSVMIGLLFASIWSWAIIIERARRLKVIGKQTEAFENRFWKANSFEDIREAPGKAEHPATKVFAAAMSEWRRSTAGGKYDRVGLRTRLTGVMGVAIAREVDALSDRLNILATIGSVSPFVGLFGTVWGIMRAFTSIAATQNTSLAVVAPGIAEALFATAMGLFAAIPAVIGYNRLLFGIGRIEGRLHNFAEEFQGELSRELETMSPKV